MKALAIAFALVFLPCCVAAQSRAPISIALRDSSHSLLVIDSVNWSEAWIETVGEDALVPLLTPAHLRITSGHDSARVFSIDSIGSSFRSRLRLSLVLDNSASMFHSYDTLTKYLDSLLAVLPVGVRAQAVTFDNAVRQRSSRFTERRSVYLAQTGFQDSLRPIQAFYHYYDSIRVGYTPFFDAIRLAIENIPDDASGPNVVIAITDGDDNASATSVEDLGRLVRSEHIRLFLITLNDISLRLKWLAKVSGGSWYAAYDAEDLRNLLHDLGLTMTRSYHVRYLFPSLSPSSPYRHQ